MASPAVQRQVQAIIGLCRSGRSSAELRGEVLRRLDRLVPIDAAFFATVDPATLLFTSAAADEPLRGVTSLLMDNEFGGDDVNKFATLAASHDPVSSLDRATSGDRLVSRRYRDVMAPLALGDELRAALVVGGRCWGVMCLHRQDGPTGFSDTEIRLVRGLLAHLAEGLRHAVLVAGAVADSPSTGPGIVVLNDNMVVVSANPAGAYWLDQLGVEPGDHAAGLPLVVHTVSARLNYPSTGGSLTPARVRVRTTGGRWLVVHASHLHGPTLSQTAIVFEPAASSELSSLILDAHGITPAQSRVAAVVLQGRSTQQIVNDLAISTNTVQEHLRAVFDKFGVGSRRELVAVLLGGTHR